MKAVAAVFLLTAIALTGVLPLWIDEIIQLRETRNTSPAQLIASLPHQPGAAPLGYLIQQTTLRTTGYSVRWARFPSAVFMAGTVLVVALLAAELGLAKPWIAAALFALFPVTIRYATESRIYSQALFLSTLATLLLMRLVKTPAWRFAALHCLVLTAAVYTQPYAIFVGFAHIVWATFYDRKILTQSTAAVALAIAAFLPWYLWTKANWSAGLAGTDVHFAYSAKTPLMLFRELIGAGYWGSGLLLILWALSLWGRRNRLPKLLPILIAVPIALALIADAAFGYFIATRQIIWVLPAVAILAAQAIELRPPTAITVAALLAAICLWQSYRFFTTPRENWELAANRLAAEVNNSACLVVVPADQEYPYEFFRPGLADTHCPAPRTVIAFTPFATKAQRETAVSALTAQGYTRQSSYEAGKSEIALFAR